MKIPVKLTPAQYAAFRHVCRPYAEQIRNAVLFDAIGSIGIARYYHRLRDPGLYPQRKTWRLKIPIEVMMALRKQCAFFTESEAFEKPYQDAMHLVRYNPDYAFLKLNM
jgi:hypothetical protein